MRLSQPKLAAAYWISIKISLIVRHARRAGRAWPSPSPSCAAGLPSWLRSATLTFSGVASNFAGVPLAFAFIATLGRLGLVTILLRDVFGINIYSLGFNILSFWGLTLTYLYFQIPLMIVIITPAIDGLKKEWGEAAATLGATNWQYWRMVVIPVLWPSFLGTVDPAFRQCLRRGRHRLCADRRRHSTSCPSSCLRRYAATCCTIRISAMRSHSA